MYFLSISFIKTNLWEICQITGTLIPEYRQFFIKWFSWLTFRYNKSPLYDVHKHGEQSHGTFGVTHPIYAQQTIGSPLTATMLKSHKDSSFTPPESQNCHMGVVIYFCCQPFSVPESSGMPVTGSPSMLKGYHNSLIALHDWAYE